MGHSRRVKLDFIRETKDKGDKYTYWKEIFMWFGKVYVHDGVSMFSFIYVTVVKIGYL